VVYSGVCIAVHCANILGSEQLPHMKMRYCVSAAHCTWKLPLYVYECRAPAAFCSRLSRAVACQQVTSCSFRLSE
jgi:hypothetical protein